MVSSVGDGNGHRVRSWIEFFKASWSRAAVDFLLHLDENFPPYPPFKTLSSCFMFTLQLALESMWASLSVPLLFYHSVPLSFRSALGFLRFTFFSPHIFTCASRPWKGFSFYQTQSSSRFDRRLWVFSGHVMFPISCCPTGVRQWQIAAQVPSLGRSSSSLSRSEGFLCWTLDHRTASQVETSYCGLSVNWILQLVLFLSPSNHRHQEGFFLKFLFYFHRANCCPLHVLNFLKANLSW